MSAAAARLGVGTAHVRAVIAVEADARGFLDVADADIRLPKILFEAHVFGRETAHRFDASHPDLSSPHWDRSLYRGGAAEYARLRAAAALDSAAAYRACSWGLFQIMGFNHAAAGYPKLLDFVGAQYISEGLQLQCGVSFMLSEGLDHALRAENWAAFAEGYNGSAYARHRYDAKLAAAFARYRDGAVVPDAAILQVQRALQDLGYQVSVDGVPGPQTTAVIRGFQRDHGLATDGIPGPNTRAALGLA